MLAAATLQAFGQANNETAGVIATDYIPVASAHRGRRGGSRRGEWAGQGLLRALARAALCSVRRAGEAVGERRLRARRVVVLLRIACALRSGCSLLLNPAAQRNAKGMLDQPSCAKSQPCRVGAAWTATAKREALTRQALAMCRQQRTGPCKAKQHRPIFRQSAWLQHCAHSGMQKHRAELRRTQLRPRAAVAPRDRHRRRWHAKPRRARRHFRRRSAYQRAHAALGSACHAMSTQAGLPVPLTGRPAPQHSPHHRCRPAIPSSAICGRAKTRQT